MQERPNFHPGEILEEEFLKSAGLTAKTLAQHLNVPAERIEGIVAGRKPVCVDTALRLSRFFGTSDRFWLEVQLSYDLERARRASGAIDREVDPLWRSAVAGLDSAA